MIRDLAELAMSPEAARVPVRSRTANVQTAAGARLAVVDPPDSIAQRAGRPLEVVSLARLVRSEGYGGAPAPGTPGLTLERATARAAAGVAIAQVAVATARRRKTSVTKLLTGSVYPELRGLYGEQGGGRWAATTQDARAWEYELAAMVLAGDVPELVGSKGTHFLDPAIWGEAIRKGQDATQAGRKLQGFESVVRRWIVDEGNRYKRNAVPGVDDYHLAIFEAWPGSTKAQREDNLAELLDTLQRGINGVNAPAPGDPDGSGFDLGGPLVALVAAGLALALVETLA